MEIQWTFWAINVDQIRVLFQNWQLCMSLTPQDPNTERIKKNAIYNGNMWRANFRGKPPFQATKEHFHKSNTDQGAGIAQWSEHRTRDWKVAGSNPCWNGGRIFFSRVDFLCWLLFRYPFHPRVTAVARKKSRSFCQKCRWQVTAKHAYTLRMWILLNRASALVTTCP